MFNRNTAAVFVAAGLALAGCDNRSSTTTTPAPPAVTKAPPTNPPAATEAPAGTNTLPADADTMLRDLAASLGSGNADAVKAVFISRATYESLFKGENLGDYHASMKQLFDKSVDDNIKGLAGATYVKTQMVSSAKAGNLPAGTTLHERELAADILELHDVTLVVKNGGQEKAVTLESVLKTPEGWRLISPLRVGPRGLDTQ